MAGAMRGRGTCMVGGACMAGGHAWLGGMHGRGTCMVGGGMHGKEACMAGGMHGRGCVWQGVCVAGGVRGIVNERAVRILLECILVLLIFHFFRPRFYFCSV